MKIFSIKSGRVLYQGPERTIKRALQTIIKKNIDISYADLRKSDLKGANLDGFLGRGICFWGADLSGANLSAAKLEESDFRLCTLKDTCFAEADLKKMIFAEPISRIQY